MIIAHEEDLSSTKLIGVIISERQKTNKKKNPETSGLCKKARGYT